MKAYKKLFLVLLSAFLITGCVKTPKLENGEEVLASIDGKNYTANELYEKMKETYGASALIDMIDKEIISKELSNTDSYKTRAESYIKSMKEYYESTGYKWEDVLKNNGVTEASLLEYYTLSYEKNAVAENYYKSTIKDSEIEKYYKNEIIGEISAKQILIAPKTTTDMSDEDKAKANTEAYNKALEIIEKLNNGEDFATLATAYSDDESAKAGGTLAPFNKQSSYPKDFINAACKLNVGEYSKTPIQTSYGYHILYIVSKGDKPSLEDTKTTIIEALTKEAISNDENYVNVAWKAIREKYNLKINDTIVKENYKASIAQY